MSLLPLLSVACGPVADTTIDTVFDPCAPLVIDPAEPVSPAQRDSISDGISMWNRIAGAALTLGSPDLDDGDAPRIPVRFDDAGAFFHGLYDDEAGVVYVNDGIDDDHARSVTVAHELGHAFGLLHVNVDHDASVMNDGNLKTEPNDYDVDQLAAMWGHCQ